MLIKNYVLSILFLQRHHHHLKILQHIYFLKCRNVKCFQGPLACVISLKKCGGLWFSVAAFPPKDAVSTVMCEAVNCWYENWLSANTCYWTVLFFFFSIFSFLFLLCHVIVSLLFPLPPFYNKNKIENNEFFIIIFLIIFMFFLSWSVNELSGFNVIFS